MKAADSSRRSSSRAGLPALPALLRHGGRALAATVAGEELAARRHYAAALAAKVAPAKLVEIARMAHLFGGFPRAIQGLKALGDALAARGIRPPRDPAPGRTADRGRGELLFRRIYAGGSDAVLAQLDQVAPGFSRWILEDAYGRVLTRPGLTPRERELLAIAALGGLRCPLQLKSHVRGALRLGARETEIAAMLAEVAPRNDAAPLSRRRR